MSWDVLVLNYHGSPPANIDEMAAAPNPDPLGEASTVRDAISRHLDGVDWSDPTWGVYFDEGYSIEFNVGHEHSVDSIMLHVRGGGDAISAMLQFAQPNNWSLFDCSTSKFIDPENPSQEGWEGFQTYRNKIVEHYRNDTET
jgi:hypothetical protein